MIRFIRFVPGDRPMPDAGETIPGADYLGVIDNDALTPAKRRCDMDVFKAVIAGQLRHLLTIGAGFLIAKGVLDAETAANATTGLVEAGTGAAMAIIGGAWSAVQKFLQTNLVPKTETETEA